MRKPAQLLLIVFIVLAILSLACSSTVTIYETPIPPNVETVVAATFAAYTETASHIVVTVTPTMTSVPASPTAEKFGEVYIYTTVENVNLRAQPGMLFQVSRVLPMGTRLKLLGRAPGGEWLSVLGDDGVIGWVHVNVVRVAYDGPPPPVVEPTDVLLVTGKLDTESGTPVSGVGFAVSQGINQTQAVTDKTGQFYAYLPRAMNGIWTVEYTSVSCTSNTMDANCSCIAGKCGSSNPTKQTVTLPQNEPLKFVWK
ncbi:MAG: SH3 domain-containing protein [Anaerolineales bacterium]|nr:SH3 domain-containing protein [Anaerolineales bacterium]